VFCEMYPCIVCPEKNLNVQLLPTGKKNGFWREFFQLKSSDFSHFRSSQTEFGGKNWKNKKIHKESESRWSNLNVFCEMYPCIVCPEKNLNVQLLSYW
jgi:hypothetical protein